MVKFFVFVSIFLKFVGELMVIFKLGRKSLSGLLKFKTLVVFLILLKFVE